MTNISSLQVTDNEAAAVATAPRVSLKDIEAKISAEYTFTADTAVKGCPIVEPLKTFTIHVIVMKNGFVVLGKTAPASPENFNAELGHKFAREDAIRQLWPLEGYALREKLSA